MKYDSKFITKEIASGQTVFNADKAIKGQTLAALKTVEGEEVMYSVENFKLVTSDKYSATVDGVTHYYDIDGNCVDGSGAGNLVFVKGDIQKSIDNAATSGDSGGDPAKKATISSLNPRDYFAQEVMNGFMRNIDKPFNLSDADIYKYTTLSYKIAQSMINVSADNRSTDPQSSSTDPSAEVVIDKATLNGNTEKLLNNIVAALDKTNAEITVGTEVDLKAERITIPELNKLIEDLKTLQENYVKDGNSTVGLKDLIAAIGNIDFTNLISAITNMSTVRTANIGSNGLGSSANNPLYISGGNSWPSIGSLSRLTSYVYGLIAFDTGDTLGYYRLSDLITEVTTESVFTNAVDARIKQFAADLKTANPSLNITIPSNWTT
jgi:hypothetical protein